MLWQTLEQWGHKHAEVIALQEKSYDSANPDAEWLAR